MSNSKGKKAGENLKRKGETKERTKENMKGIKEQIKFLQGAKTRGIGDEIRSNIKRAKKGNTFITFLFNKISITVREDSDHAAILAKYLEVIEWAYYCDSGTQIKIGPYPKPGLTKEEEEIKRNIEQKQKEKEIEIFKPRMRKWASLYL